MNTPLTALLLVALLLLWLYIRRRQSRPVKAPKPTATTPTRRKSTAYHAVSIQFGSNACDAAREMDGRRFLSSAAPRLPLPDCDVLECRCRFIHHEDRRSGRDRRSPFQPGGFSSSTGSYRKEQRQGGDRRRSPYQD